MPDVYLPEPHREMTEADFQALMASEMWLWKQDLSGYEKKWIAVLGEKIIDSDADELALARRVVALGHTIDQYKVLTRYIRSFDEIEQGPECVPSPTLP
jgi:hypothetical protein